VKSSECEEPRDGRRALIAHPIQSHPIKCNQIQSDGMMQSHLASEKDDRLFAHVEPQNAAIPFGGEQVAQEFEPVQMTLAHAEHIR